MQFSKILFVVLASCTHLINGNQNISYNNLANLVSQLDLINVSNFNTDLLLVAFYLKINYIKGNTFSGLERKTRNQSTKFFG